MKMEVPTYNIKHVYMYNTFIIIIIIIVLGLYNGSKTLSQ